MVSEKQIERVEPSAAKLTVSVAQPTVREEYDKLVREYAKNVQIKGFRKGKVPIQIMELKFGETLKAEAAQKILEESLKEVFDEIEEKPLPYGQPELDGELDFDLDKPFTFSVRYDIFPEITVGPYTGLEIEEPRIEVGDEDLDRELKSIQEKNSVVIDKTDPVVANDDIVTIDYEEVNGDDAPVEGSRREDFVFTVGSGYNYYRLDDDVVGMKLGETRTIEKQYADDAETEELRGTTRRISVTVKAVKQRQLPEIDDELAQDVSEKYETLADLKKDIRERLERAAADRVRQMKADALVEKIREGSQITLPESMIAAELESSWQNFVGRFGASEAQVAGFLQQQGRSKEALQDEWRPEAEKSLKARLLINRILEQEKIKVSDEDIDAKLKEQADEHSMSFDEVKEYYRKQGMLDYLRSNIAEERLFDRLFEQSTIKKGKKQKFVDVMGRNS